MFLAAARSGYACDPIGVFPPSPGDRGPGSVVAELDAGGDELHALVLLGLLQVPVASDYGAWMGAVGLLTSRSAM